LQTEELLLKNYDDFFGLIQHFGMGMVIFPSLMHDLGGSYSIQMIGVNENLRISLEDSPAEQDIKAPSLIIGNNNDVGVQSLGQMKI
jgi:hypothetical protein